MALTVSEAATKVGLSAHTLRWYEREGLVEPVRRDSAGRRRYSDADIDWLVLLCRLRRTGMPVREMRRYADLARQEGDTTAERLALLSAHRDRVLARMGELAEDLKVLDFKIELYGGGNA
jgi:DNA-binding transcriptional MerR regulator